MLDATESEPAFPYESAGELRKQHSALLEALDWELGRDPSAESEAAALARLELEIRRFLDRGAATGVYLDDIKERTACQVMLDYWVSSLSRAGIQESRARLKPFDGDRLPVLKDEACPYVGLDPFHDQMNFFGREADTLELRARILELPLVVVIGASGSGKSSIVMAGVLPALRTRSAPPEMRLAPPFVPGNAVLDNLVNAVREVHHGAGLSTAQEAALLRRDPQHLLEMMGGPGAPPTLITIDQFEEVFTLSDFPDREALVGNLTRLLDAGRGHRVILTVRAEFDSRINELLPLAPYREKARFWMRPMSYAELKSAVEKPAESVNLQFNPGITDDLVKKVLGQPAALPLLQFTLRSLWEKRKRNRITWEIYTTVGDPLKALEKSADDFCLSQMAQTREEIERILRELVWVDELLEAYRQPVPRSCLLRAGKANTEEVLDMLAKHDFVRVIPGAAEDMVEIKHEALVRNWPRFVGWIEEKRRQRRERLALTQAAKQWEGSRKPEDLFAGWQLQEAKSQSDLSDQEKAFIEAGNKAADLKQKEKEAALRWRMLAWVFGILAALLICGILLYRYLFVWEYSAYYNDCVRVHGIPVGVGKELTTYQQRSRACSLRLVRKGRWGDDERDLLIMEAVNGSGTLNPYNRVGTYFDPEPEASPAHECRWEYIRDSRGRIMYEKAYNRFGTAVWALIYSPPSEGPILGRSQYVHKLYKEGKHSLRGLFKAYVRGEPVEYPKTREALYLKEESIGRAPVNVPFASVVPTEPKKAPPGVEPEVPGQSDRQAGLSAAGRDSKASASDKAPGMAFVFSGAKVVSVEYSIEGYEWKVRYFDEDRNPVTGPNKAYGKIRRFSEVGLELETTSIGPDGVPMNDEAGYATLKMTHDDYGNVKVTEAFDSSGHPALVQSGWHSFHAWYDDRGNRTEGAYFGLKGEPVHRKEGYHRQKALYDEQGNRIAWEYFDASGARVRVVEGYHKVTGKYDEYGNRTEWAFYDENQKGMLYEGYHKVTGKYEGGNRIEWAYFGLDGERILLKEGFHRVTGRYDNRGNQTEWAYFGTNDEPVLQRDGFHKTTVTYDERGTPMEWAYFGREGEPVLLKDGYHKETGKYDRRGNRIEWAYFGAKGEPVLFINGYHKAAGKYDARGNRMEWAFFGTNGEPVLHKEGFHKVTGKYDDHGNRIEWAFFDRAGKPMLYLGYHSLTGGFDAAGNQVDWAYFGVEGEPVICRDGYHRAVGKYDERGNRTEWAYFGTRGEPALYMGMYHRETGRYDERGNRMEWAYFGVRGEPALQEGGFSRVTGKYDERGHRTEWAYFGTRGERIRLEAGCHKETAKYDPQGNETERACYGTDEKPAMNSSGYFRIIQKFDESGQLLEMRTYDEDDNLTVNKYGFAWLMKKYDKLGRVVENATFGADGKPKVALYDYARITLKYDEHGNLAEEAYFGADGNPRLLNSGCARYVYRHLDDGTMVEKTCFDTAGKINESIDAYARVIRKLGPGNLPVEERYFASDGSPARFRVNGQHVIRYAYDSRGNKTEERYYGIHDEPVKGVSPAGEACLRWSARYDSSNKLIESRCHLN